MESNDRVARGCVMAKHAGASGRSERSGGQAVPMTLGCSKLPHFDELEEVAITRKSKV